MRNPDQEGVELLSMQKLIGTALGKTIGQVTKIRGSGGQALPGLFVEKIFPKYPSKMLAQLPEGVVIITGTNGKTTTTKMVVDMLRSAGKKVLTNKTGSNLTRGIISSLVHNARLSGRLDYDIAIFELDEAFARLFVKNVPTRWVLALNVTRDQLDRFGEVDTTAAMIAETMACAHQGIIVNANDPRLLPAAESISKKNSAVLKTFGLSKELEQFFPTENELVAVEIKSSSYSNSSDVILVKFNGQTVTYKIDGKEYSAELKLSGQHNFQNAAAAIALSSVILPGLSATELLTMLSQVEPAFGRGEIFNLGEGNTMRLVLVKNPAGFRQALASYPPNGATVMIAINDNIADSRDVSWLWDVDFTSLQEQNIKIVSGKRAADMALRLSYDSVSVGKIEPSLRGALDEFTKLSGSKLLFTTYTAMLWLHKELKKGAKL